MKRNRLLPSLLLSLSCLFCCVAPVRAQRGSSPSPEIKALLDKAKTEEGAYRQEAAQRLYEEALKQAKERKDRAGEGATLVALAVFYIFQKPAKSQEYLELGLTLYREIQDPYGEGRCLLNLGNVASIRAQTAKAMEYFEATYRLYEQHKVPSGQAAALNGIGLMHLRNGETTKGLDCYKRAVQIYAETQEPASQGRILMNIGTIYGRLSQPTQAITHFNQALEIARTHKDRSAEAQCFYNLAFMERLRGDYTEAIELLLKAIAINIQIGNRHDEGVCYSGLASNYADLGYLLKSLEYSQRALTISEDLEDRRNVVLSLETIGSFYADIGQNDKALDYYQRALEKNKKIGDISAEAGLINNMGRLYSKTNQMPKAIALLEQSLALSRKTGDKKGEAYTQYYLNGCYNKMANLLQAQLHGKQALALFNEVGEVGGVASAELQLGTTYLLAKKSNEAKSHYERALRLFAQSREIPGQAMALSHLAMAEEDLGLANAADAHHQEALTLFESMRANLGMLTEAKVAYLDTHSSIHYRYLNFLLKEKQAAKSFELVQKLKARTLTDLMEAGKIDPAREISAEDRKEELRLKRRDKELAENWIAATQEIEEATRRPSRGQGEQERLNQQRQRIQREQQQLEQDWRQFRERLYLKNPHLAQQRAAQTLRLDEAAAMLPEDAALLEYVFHPDGSDVNQTSFTDVAKSPKGRFVLYVVTKQGGKPRLTMHALPTEAKALAKLASEFRSACAGRPNTPAERPYKELARQLYRLLIAPAESQIAAKRHLIICPYGPLWDAPFQALIAPNPAAKQQSATFLWERFSITYAYSATAAKANLEARNRPNRPKPEQQMLVVANPDFGATAGTQTASANPRRVGREFYLRGRGLGALPHTRAEAEAIRAAFPQATLKMGKEAQEEFLKRNSPRYRYLHLATHGIFHDAAPMLSGLALAQPPKDSPDDGILTARELFDLSLSADLIVLSACETGRGTQRTGEGMIGLTWALFVAGTSTQIVSQWAVDDAATAQLMRDFYRHLGQGGTKEAALRTAALGLMRAGKRAHPFYWSPFFLVGDWR